MIWGYHYFRIHPYTNMESYGFLCWDGIPEVKTCHQVTVPQQPAAAEAKPVHLTCGVSTVVVPGGVPAVPRCCQGLNSLFHGLV